MTPIWVALLEEDPHDAERTVAAEAQEGGVLFLRHVADPASPHRRARLADPRIVGTGGPPMCTTWTELAEDRRPLFDAPEVLEARRKLLRNWPAYGVSTLVTDGVHLAGAVLLWPGGPLIGDDPFARMGWARVLNSRGFFVPLPPPTGPALERYAGSPWPFDRFPPTAPEHT